jgi:hypothetical protein
MPSPFVIRTDALGNALEFHLRTECLTCRLSQLWARNHHRASSYYHLPANLVCKTVRALRCEDVGQELRNVAKCNL